MEGQIWKFRTRTGEYQGYATTSRLDSHKEEAKLEQSAFSLRISITLKMFVNSKKRERAQCLDSLLS